HRSIPSRRSTGKKSDQPFLVPLTIVRPVFGLLPDVFGECSLQGFPRGLGFYLVIDGRKVNTDDHDDKHQAYPEHRTVHGKKCSPEEDNKRDQVKHDPRPQAGNVHSINIHNGNTNVFPPSPRCAGLTDKKRMMCREDSWFLYLHRADHYDFYQEHPSSTCG